MPEAGDRLTRWGRALPWVLWTWCAVLWAARWPSFPVLLDPAYHLCVALQMRDAGGILAYEWWQHAPVGRPHLYPPVLHVVLTELLAVGMSPIGAIRTLSALIIPALLLTILLVARHIWSEGTALGALMIAMAPWSWFLHLAGTLASGMALIELLWLAAACQSGRLVAATCLMALLWLTHLGLPWVALAGLLAYWLTVNGPRRGRVVSALGLGTLLAVPWLWHVARSFPTMRLAPRAENQAIELLPAIYVLAAAGAWRTWRVGGRARLLVWWLVAFGLMAASFRFRWLAAEGLLPIVLLGGWMLDDAARRLAGRWKRPALRPWVVAALGVLAIAGPTLRVVDGRMRAVWPDAALLHLIDRFPLTPSPLDVQLYGPYAERLVHVLQRVSRPGEIVWTNAPYAGGLIAALARRPTSTAMLSEVPPFSPLDPVDAAQVVLWLKIGPLPGTPALDRLIASYGLVRIADDAVASIFRHPGARPLARAPRAVVPLWISGVLLWGLFGLVVWDFHRQRVEKDNVWQR